MKNVRFYVLLLLMVFSAGAFSGCTLLAGREQAYFYERPSIGFTAKDEVTTEVELQGQNSLTLTAEDGVITIVPYEGKTLRLTEKRRLTGPSTPKALKAMLDKRSLKIEKDVTEVTIDMESGEKQKPLYRLTDDVELKVPKGVFLLNITAKSGKIALSGFSGMSSLDLGISKGNIEVTRCEAYQLIVNVTQGNLEIAEFSGDGTYECGKGNNTLRDIKGDIELSSLAGNTRIEEAEGRLECDVSSGSMTVGSSRISGGSVLYASNGTIDADLSNLDASGKYEIKASKGELKLKLSGTAGWSLLAESTNGRIKAKPFLSSGELKWSPTGELYGDVRGGGPAIDVYTDMGDIALCQ
jgi:hypothetical protein